jgi:hypothetical protein
MAIIRAQQAKQMLQKGGRIGLFQGALADTAKGSPMSPGTSVGGNTRGGTGKGRDLDVQQRGSTKAQYNRMVAEGTQGSYKRPGPDKPPQITDREPFVPTKVPKGISAIERFRNNQIQKSINRNKVLALRKLGLLPKPSISPIGAIFQSFEQIPEEFELMSEEDLLKIATSGPYLSQQKTVGDVNRFTSGKDLLGRTFEAEDLLRKGDMTQTKFEELFPGPDIPDDRGPDQQETDPCKGPNPPAYCFANVPSDPITPPTSPRNLGGLAPRFTGSIFDFTGMADGGRIGAAEGGIMDLETGRQMYFLGKLVKKATRAVKKITKSPLGKAAILGGLAYFGGQGGGFTNLLKKGFLKDTAGKFALENLSPLKTIGIVSALSGLMATQEEEEKITDKGPELSMEELIAIRNNPFGITAPRFEGSTFAFAADGGRIGYQEGSKEPVAKKTMPLLDMGGQEMDLRDNGGFVPIGRMEKADDVPARLSKNEFVFTADAVRNAGDGDVDKGAEVMYNMMKNLESGGEVSEESQGLEGARKMFQTSKRLEEVI